jgi:hypothetical protein
LRDHQVGPAISIEIPHLHQAQIQGLVRQTDREIGLRWKAASGTAAMNRDFSSPADLNEVGAPVAVEIPGEL